MFNDLKDKNLWKQTLFVFILIMIFMLPIFIKNKGILIYPGDSFEEFFQYLNGGWQKMHDCNLSFWDWSIGLGANSFSYSLYYLFSPFFWILVLFPKRMIPYLMTFLGIIKLLCIFIFSNLWLKKLNRSELTRFIGSCMITFSGWIFFYFHYYNFTDAFVFFPLILYYIEDFLQNGKYKGIIFSLFLLTINNYYFLYLFIQFLDIYLFTLKILKLEKCLRMHLNSLFFVFLELAWVRLF